MCSPAQILSSPLPESFSFSSPNLPIPSPTMGPPSTPMSPFDAPQDARGVFGAQSTRAATGQSVTSPAAYLEMQTQQGARRIRNSTSPFGTVTNEGSATSHNCSLNRASPKPQAESVPHQSCASSPLLPIVGTYERMQGKPPSELSDAPTVPSSVSAPKARDEPPTGSVQNSGSYW
jgi:hypothetical protein